MSETILYNFTGGADGQNPYETIILDAAGDIFGLSSKGGAGGYGAVFEIAVGSTTPTILHSFTSAETNGVYSTISLTLSSTGDLYGVLPYGGANEAGAVFEIDTITGSYSTIASFVLGSSGYLPRGGVVVDADGNVFGTSSFRLGTLYEIPAGSDTVQTLVTFDNATSGYASQASLITDASGNLFGTTSRGGANGGGVLFEYSASGSFTILYSFASHSLSSDGLAVDAAGDIFGTISGTSSYVYEYSASGVFTILHSFAGGTDGSAPIGQIALDAAGNLYGATNSGGSAGYGTVYEITADGTYKILYNFTGGSDGAYPYGGITLDAAGNIFGTTYSGGTDNLGTIFEIEAACYYPGTLIATPTGPRAVEQLAIGELVLTHEGMAEPIRWIGRNNIATRFADPNRTLPIRITAGALGAGLPQRDLLVSPEHAVLAGGLLVEAGALINGRTILRECNVPEHFTYYHIELAAHALLLAEGLPAESFVDNLHRMAFENWAEHEALYGPAPVTELPLPRAKSWRQLPPALRARLTPALPDAA